LPAKPTGGITGPTIMTADATSSQIGPYKIKKDLGEGTFGLVKLGQHVETGELVAIKIMNKASAKTPKQKVSVQREVRLMKLLDHPHIVGVIDVFETNDLYIVIMEVIEFPIQSGLSSALIHSTQLEVSFLNIFRLAVMLRIRKPESSSIN